MCVCVCVCVRVCVFTSIYMTIKMRGCICVYMLSVCVAVFISYENNPFNYHNLSGDGFYKTQLRLQRFQFYSHSLLADLETYSLGSIFMTCL